MGVANCDLIEVETRHTVPGIPRKRPGAELVLKVYDYDCSASGDLQQAFSLRRVSGQTGPMRDV